MTKASTYEDSTFGLYPPSGGGLALNMERGTSEGRKYWDVSGIVATRFCFVFVRSFYYDGAYDGSTLQAIKNGKFHERRFNKAFTKKGLVTKAKRFAKELHTESK